MKFIEGKSYTLKDGENDNVFTILKDRGNMDFDIMWNNGAVRTISLAGFEHLWVRCYNA